MVETWKDIPGYGGKYQVDKEGNVRRVYASGATRPMTPYHRKMSGSQRLVVKLTRDGREKEEVLRRLQNEQVTVEKYLFGNREFKNRVD